MSLLRNVRVRNSRWGRRFKTAALMALPAGIVLAVLRALKPGDFEMDRSLGYGIFMLLIFPTLIMEALVLICRKVRTMRCHQCGWEQDFPFAAANGGRPLDR